MLTKVTLEHFKCFERLDMPLASLTLLSGMNAAGKSTTLQALTLLHQSAVENEWNRALILNGRVISLGAAGDIIDKITGRLEFGIGLDGDDFECAWNMACNERSELAVTISEVRWREADSWELNTSRGEIDGERLYHLLPEEVADRSPRAQGLIATLTRLAYISAERIGPRETYPATTPEQQTNVGPHGEYTPWFIDTFDQLRRPLDGLLIEDESPTLRKQTGAWMNHFFPGAGFEVAQVPGANLMTMGIRTSTATDFHRPQNVGFGITHLLPIIVSCLGAAPGDVVLIENPESHLHPAGQSKIGRFLARAAAAGAQIILETHSDHVLNGVRRAVKDGFITPEQVAIHFFRPRDESGKRAQVLSPLLDHNGNIDQWPNGFFDQIDKDLSQLIDW